MDSGRAWFLLFVFSTLVFVSRSEFATTVKLTKCPIPVCALPTCPPRMTLRKEVEDFDGLVFKGKVLRAPAVDDCTFAYAIRVLRRFKGCARRRLKVTTVCSTSTIEVGRVFLFFARALPEIPGRISLDFCLPVRPWVKVRSDRSTARYLKRRGSKRRCARHCGEDKPNCNN